MIISVTGHRPPDLGGYSEEAFNLLVELAKRRIEKLEPEEVIQGMALGWDQACATACWKLGVPYAAYIPFEEQAKTWPLQSRHRWATLRDHAAREHVFGKKYELELMHKRNTAVILDGEIVLANFNGYKYSGTAHAIGEAERLNRQIINVYQEWKSDYERSGIKND